MSEIQFTIPQKTKIKISIYGETYDLTKPTVGQVEKLGLASDKMSPMEQLDYTMQFMSAMGLPREISQAMEVDQFNKLVEFVLDASKKK